MNYKVKCQRCNNYFISSENNEENCYCDFCRSIMTKELQASDENIIRFREQQILESIPVDCSTSQTQRGN